MAEVGGHEPARLHASEAARILEVGAKDVTEREAQAECVVTMTPWRHARSSLAEPRKVTRSRQRGSRA